MLITRCGYFGNDEKVLLIDTTLPKDQRVSGVWCFILLPGVGGKSHGKLSPCQKC